MTDMEMQYAIGYAHGQGKTDFSDIFSVVRSKSSSDWPIDQDKLKRQISEIDEQSKRIKETKHYLQMKAIGLYGPHDV